MNLADIIFFVLSIAMYACTVFSIRKTPDTATEFYERIMEFYLIMAVFFVILFGIILFGKAGYFIAIILLLLVYKIVKKMTAGEVV